MPHANHQQRGGKDTNQIQRGPGARSRTSGFQGAKKVKQRQGTKCQNDEPADTLRPKAPNESQGVRRDDELQASREKAEDSETSHNSGSFRKAV